MGCFLTIDNVGNLCKWGRYIETVSDYSGIGGDYPEPIQTDPIREQISEIFNIKRIYDVVKIIY